MMTEVENLPTKNEANRIFVRNIEIVLGKNLVLNIVLKRQGQPIIS